MTSARAGSGSTAEISEPTICSIVMPPTALVDEANAQVRIDQQERIRGIRGGRAQQLFGTAQLRLRLPPRRHIVGDADEAARRAGRIEQRPRDRCVRAVAAVVRLQPKLFVHLAVRCERRARWRDVAAIRSSGCTRAISSFMPGNVAGQVHRSAIHDGELEHIARLVPAPGMHVRHVHRQFQPPGAVLERNLRELLRLDVLHGAEGAERPAVELLEVPDHADPDAPVL